MMRRPGVSMLALILPIGLAPSAALSWQTVALAQVEPPPADGASPDQDAAAAVYDSVGSRLIALDAAYFGSLAPGEVDPVALYLVTGAADARLRTWLDALRVLGAEAIRATDLPYERPFDPKEGGLLGPAHLAPLRAVDRGLATLALDAAVREDAAAITPLLRAQVTLATRSSHEGSLASSVAAIHVVESHVRTVAELIDRGAIDATRARELLAVRAKLDEQRDFGLQATLDNELVLLQAEIDRILLTPASQRSHATAGLRRAAPIRLDDDALHRARQSSEVYLLEAGHALANAEIAETRREIASLEHRLGDGEFGDLIKLLAPRLLPAVEALIAVRTGLDAQDMHLGKIANGDERPASLANAGHYLVRAAREAMRIPLADQAAIDALRVSSKTPSATAVRDARKAIDACRSAVIDQVLLAAAAQRCAMPEICGSGLVRAATMGLNGAVRVVLADAFGPGARPKDAPSRGDAVLACLRVAADCAAAGTYSHSLVAQQIVRDLKAPVAELAKRGELTKTLRLRITETLDAMPAADPLGFDAAFAAECRSLANHTCRAGGVDVAVFSLPQLEQLRPNELAFLLAMFTRRNHAPFDAPRGGPLDGALVDIRAWFDLAAFKRATEQASLVVTRAMREPSRKRSVDTELKTVAVARDNTAVGWLDVTTPVNIDARRREASGDVAAIRAVIDRANRAAARQTTQADRSDD